MALVAEVPVTSVTANAVCRQAGISRNAFYLHHASTAALYAALVDELMADIRAESNASVDRRMGSGGRDDFEGALVGALAKHEDVLRALLPSDDGSLVKCLADGIEEAFVEAALRFGEHGGSFEHRLRCAYSAWALVGFVQRWITDCDHPFLEGMDRFWDLNASTSESAAKYDSGHAGIYEMCKGDYPPILAELRKDGFENLLDVGCGTGRMIELLASEMPGKRYTGLDLTPRMIEVANAKGVLEVLDVEPDPGPKVPQGNKPMVLM